MTRPGVSTGPLALAALLAIFAGATGSLTLMFLVGRRNQSRILMLLFTLWVLMPYVSLFIASKVSRRWTPNTRAALQSMTLIVAAVSVAIYAVVAFGPPRPQPAFWFLIVPPASLILTSAVVALTARIPNKQQS